MRLRLLSYNIHKAIGLDRRFDPGRIALILRHHQADIALLQEVDRGQPRSGLLDLASYLSRQLGYRYRAVGINVFLKRGKYGNATLSHFPIGRQRNIDLSAGAVIRRGAQHTRIHLDQGGRLRELDVFNVHLSLTARLRRRQVQHLLATADLAHLPADAACIIAGDMNDWHGDLRRRFFEPAGFACATNRRAGSRRAIKTFPSFAPAGGLDRIFYRGPLVLLRAYRSRLAVARLASDHLPLVAEFEL